MEGQIVRHQSITQVEQITMGRDEEENVSIYNWGNPGILRGDGRRVMEALAESYVSIEEERKEIEQKVMFEPRLVIGGDDADTEIQRRTQHQK